MKKYYKVASLALAGAITAGSLVPVSSYAEELNSDETVNVEPSNETIDSQVAEQTPAAEALSNEAAEVETAETEPTETNDDASDEEVTEEVTDEMAEEASEDVEAENPEETEELLTEEELLKKEQEEKERLEKERAERELLEPKDNEDFNEDGISDLMTKRLCDGEVLTKDGAKAFGSLSYEEVQATDDLDGDGLLNGQEVSIISEDGIEYVVLNSDPCKLDTDGDGINDADDTAPWERGMAGGVLGSVRLVARHDESTGNPTHGHVYIVYTSYVDNLEISIDNLYGYYVTNPEYKAKLDEACDNPDGSVVSWRSTVDEITDANEAERAEAAKDMYQEQNHTIGEAGTVTLNRGDYVSIGNYGMLDTNEAIQNVYLPEATRIFAHNDADIAKLWSAATGENVDEEYVREHQQEIMESLQKDFAIFVDYATNVRTEGGVWINRELFNQKYAYDQGPNQVIEREATQQELNVMLDAFAKNSYFNIITHNCSTVGCEAWNSTYGYETDSNGQVITDENGVPKKSNYYVEVGMDTGVVKVDCPMIVKQSIKSMADLPGYLGEMTYVTGKKLVNTINTAVKHFDITKLFTKKNSSANNSGSNQSSSSYSSASDDSSNNESYRDNKSYPVGDVETFSSITGKEQVLEEDTVAPQSGRTTKSSTKRATTVDSVYDLEPEVTEEEEIKQETNIEAKEEVKIQDEENPLAGKHTSRGPWIWGVVAAFIAAVSAAICIVIKKKNS